MRPIAHAASIANPTPASWRTRRGKKIGASASCVRLECRRGSYQPHSARCQSSESKCGLTTSIAYRDSRFKICKEKGTWHGLGARNACPGPAKWGLGCNVSAQGDVTMPAPSQVADVCWPPTRHRRTRQENLKEGLASCQPPKALPSGGSAGGSPPGATSPQTRHQTRSLHCQWQTRTTRSRWAARPRRLPVEQAKQV